MNKKTKIIIAIIGIIFLTLLVFLIKERQSNERLKKVIWEEIISVDVGSDENDRDDNLICVSPIPSPTYLEEWKEIISIILSDSSLTLYTMQSMIDKEFLLPPQEKEEINYGE